MMNQMIDGSAPAPSPQRPDHRNAKTAVAGPTRPAGSTQASVVRIAILVAVLGAILLGSKLAAESSVLWAKQAMPPLGSWAKPETWGAVHLASAIVAAALAILSLTLAWWAFALGIEALSLLRLRPRQPTTHRPTTRKIAALILGLTLSANLAVNASAAPIPDWGPEPAPTSSSAPAQAGAQAAPSAATSGAGHHAQPSTQNKAPQPSAQSNTVVVLRGDTLWDIAKKHLGDQATPAQIAHEWPRWYRANQHIIGSNPDLILPGQILTAPTEEIS